MIAAEGRFIRICQVAPMCPLMRAHWPNLANTIELVLSLAHPSPQPNDKSIGSAVFAQFTPECPYTLQWASLSPKIVPSHAGIWTPSNTWFHGSTRVLNPNGISIGSAVFASLISVTDRQTDHATRSVSIGRNYVRSTGDAA